MSVASLKDSQVSISVSEPWEFGTECGTGPFIGIVSDATEERLVIALTAPIAYQGKTLKTVIAGPRHKGVGTQTITQKAMSANLMLLPNTIRSVSECIPGGQPDGVAAIGAVEQLASESRTTT